MERVSFNSCFSSRLFFFGRVLMKLGESFECDWDVIRCKFSFFFLFSCVIFFSPLFVCSQVIKTSMAVICLYHCSTSTHINPREINSGWGWWLRRLFSSFVVLLLNSSSVFFFWVEFFAYWDRLFIGGYTRNCVLYVKLCANRTISDKMDVFPWINIFSPSFSLSIVHFMPHTHTQKHSRFFSVDAQ